MTSIVDEPGVELAVVRTMSERDLDAVVGDVLAFARLHLNVWTAAEDRLVSDEDLRACVVLDGPLAEEEALTDFRVGQALAQKRKDFLLAIGQDRPGIGGGRTLVAS